MDGLTINSIPTQLLARILLQLHILPPNSGIDLLKVIDTALHQHRNSQDLDAFLDYCQIIASDPNQQPISQSWQWKYHDIKNDQDWETANNKSQHLVGLRFLLSTELARKNVPLIKSSKTPKEPDPKSVYFYKGRYIPIDNILNDSLNYFKQGIHDSNMNALIESVIELRLERYARDKYKAPLEEQDDGSNSNYLLIGALMARFDSAVTEGSSPDSWCLYLRDYIETEDGSSWRVLFSYGEKDKIPTEQALTDIRGAPINGTVPSEFSIDYRPVYLFYGNSEKLMMPEPDQKPDQQGDITFEDYTFDSEGEYEHDPIPEEDEDDTPCSRCGIADTIDNVNTIFYCDNCSQAVHQMCEDPPIQLFELEIDPWYCRNCSKAKGLDLPQPPHSSSLLVKRKRDEEDDKDNDNKESKAVCNE